VRKLTIVGGGEPEKVEPTSPLPATGNSRGGIKTYLQREKKAKGKAEI